MLQKWGMLFCFIVVTTVAAAQPPTLGTYPTTTIATAGRNAMVTPSAAPTNVGTIHAYTSPDFRGILAVNPVTGAVIITNAQPAGTYTVTVKCFNGILTALSSFTLTVNKTFCNQGLLGNSSSISISNKVYDVAIGDFNGDGKQDFATSNGYYPATGLSIRLGDGVGNFISMPDVPISGGNYIGSIIVNDFNGDGKQDIAGICSDGQIRILSGNGDGTFAANQLTVAADNPYTMVAGDFNSDGKPDLAISNGNGNYVSIRLGNGAGGFTNAPIVSVGTFPARVVIADFNNDSKADMAVANGGSNSISIRLGDGNGGFTGTANFSVSTQPLGLVTADFNSDGNQDCMVLCNNGLIGLLPGNGTGSFGSIIYTTVYTGSSLIITGDFNGDGKPDILLTNGSVGRITIRLGDGAGGFTSATEIAEPAPPITITNGDFNNDGRQDILYSSQTNAAFICLGGANLAEINVRGNGITINDGDLSPGTADFTDFGTSSSAVAHTFVIENTGTGALPVNSITIRGADSAMFIAGGITLPKTIAAGASDTFTVTFTPTSAGIKNAIVNIDNNDCSEKIYDFAMQGNGIASTVSIGTYLATSIAAAGGDTTIAPSAIPANAVSITALAPALFKGLLHVDPITGVVTITNAHPAGTYSVTIKAFNGFSTATSSFILTVSNSMGCNKGLFITAPNVAVGAKPLAVTVGDFNNDGRQDVATANNAANTVSVKLGNGAGGFTTGATFTVGNSPLSLAVADFNGDGKLDMAVSNNISNTVSIRLGNGVGNFSGNTEVPVGNAPQSIAIGDFNGDGRQDFAVANTNSNTISVRFGDGAGRFTGTTEISVGNIPTSVAVADFNNDSNLDLAVSNSGSGTVSIRLGNGLGGFSSATDVTVGSSPTSIVTADFNNDGNTDFSLVNRTSYSVSIRLGNGTGNFTAATGLAVGYDLTAVVPGDFNTDGKPDLAIIDNYVNVIAIRLGTGTGSFTSAVSVMGEGSSFSLAVGDFDGDGRQDIAVADTTAGGRILLRLGSVNEMTLSGNGLNIADGDAIPDATDGTDFGNVSSVKTNTYIIHNDGPADLTISSIVLSGTDASQYRVDSIALPIAIAAGVADTFAIRFLPTSAGVKSAVVTISNDDCDESVYDFAIQGTGVAASPTLGTYADSVIVTTGGRAVVTPSIPPGNAVSITASASPRFKGLLLVNPQTGVLTVSNAQPAGNYLVTVKTVNGFSTATDSFTLVITGTVCSQAQFANAANVAVTGVQQGLAVADFNGDGNQDIAATNADGITVSIRLGNGLGGFTAANDVEAGAGPYSIAVGDFNGDGRADFAVANATNNIVTIHLGTGDGNFVKSQAFAAGNVPHTIVTADFNGDGKADLAFTNYSSNNVYIRLGNGEGQFTGTTTVAVGSSPGSIIVGDFNGDGKADLAVANMAAVTASIRLGDGMGNFTTAPDVTTNSNVFSVATADFNGDGKSDLAIGNAYGNPTVVVRLGDGAGNFSGTTNLMVPYGPYAVATGDFNGDGKQDIAAILNFNNAIILTGNGTGGFTVPTTLINVGSSSRALAVGDFNNDSRMDFVAASNDPVIAIRLNTLNDINVKGNNTSIANGDNTPSLADSTDFGIASTSATVSRTFTIQNTGNGNLVISRIDFSGTDSVRFTRSGITLPATIAAGASRTFAVTFSPTEGGVRNAVVNITSDNCDKGLYTFAIRAKAICTTLSANNVWLGNTANWTTASNWSLGVVPNGCSRVVINTGTPFAPQISTQVSCYSLTLNNGATISVTGTGNLTITGP